MCACILSLNESRKSLILKNAHLNRLIKNRLKGQTWHDFDIYYGTTLFHLSYWQIHFPVSIAYSVPMHFSSLKITFKAQQRQNECVIIEYFAQMSTRILIFATKKYRGLTIWPKSSTQELRIRRHNQKEACIIQFRLLMSSWPSIYVAEKMNIPRNMLITNTTTMQWHIIVRKWTGSLLFHKNYGDLITVTRLDTIWSSRIGFVQNHSLCMDLFYQIYHINEYLS